MNNFKAGDRVKGCYAHKGKFGVVLESAPNNLYVCLKWDGGKRKVYVDSARLELVEV